MVGLDSRIGMKPRSSELHLQQTLSSCVYLCKTRPWVWLTKADRAPYVASEQAPHFTDTHCMPSAIQYHQALLCLVKKYSDSSMLFHVYECIPCVHVSMLLVCIVHAEFRRQHHIPCNWERAPTPCWCSISRGRAVGSALFILA